MNILVTGGAGFIGSNFVRYWLENHSDDEVVIFDKLTYAGNLDNLKNPPNDSKLTFIEGDILNKDHLQAIIEEKQIHTIMHFAAESHVDKSIEAPDDFIQTNIMGTYNILELLKKYPQMHLHHVSTDEVYGDLPLDKPEVKFSEKTCYAPNSPYSASKAASDHLVRAYIKTYDINATISNCSNNFGPYCYPEKLIPLAITRALNDQEIPVYGDGLQVRDWIHTEDHIKGIELILQQGQCGETYILGGNGERTNLYILQRILDYLEKPHSLLVHIGDRKGHDARYAIDFSKAKIELGFQPQKTVEERLEETIDWYIDNQHWWRDLKLDADKLAEKYLNTE